MMKNVHSKPQSAIGAGASRIDFSRMDMCDYISRHEFQAVDTVFDSARRDLKQLGRRRQPEHRVV